MKESCFYPTPLLNQFNSMLLVIYFGQGVNSANHLSSGHLELAINISGGSLITTLKGIQQHFHLLKFSATLPAGAKVAENVTLLVARF
jgi:hypothetical protein